MQRLRIRHESLYTFPHPVRFGLWRLLMRPLDTHATRLIDASLETPPSRVIWSYDAYGNCVCHLTPRDEADHLLVVNNLLVERYPSPLVDVPVDNPCSAWPVVYRLTDRIILAPFIAPAEDDESARYRAWLRYSSPMADEPALSFLRRMTVSIHDDFRYQAREEAGTQSPGQTVSRGATSPG
jgi:hypothetical protein